MADAILTPTREPSLLSSQVQQGPGHLHQQTVKPDPDGYYRADCSGAMYSWYRLAYDLYLIKHNAKLQERILDRLRHADQFQGARFELCVTASMIVAGFEIDFEDESDGTRKHAEFIAINEAGLKIAVEAKSRHRDGVLGFTSKTAVSTDRVSVERVLRAALAKEPELPYFVFVDVNLPPSLEQPAGNPWFKEMADTVVRLRGQWPSGSFPANAVFLANDPTHYVPDEVLTGNAFWCYEVPIVDARYPLSDQALTMRIAQAMLQRTTIPNEFPDF